MPHTREAAGQSATRPPAALPAHVPAKVRAALADAGERLRGVYGERLRRVVLYGSHARGDAGPESDVDVLVVLDRFEENVYRESKRASALWGDLLERYGLFVSMQLYTEAQYQDRRRPFIRNVHEDGIQL